MSSIDKADSDMSVAARAAEYRFRMATLGKMRSEKLYCNQIKELAGAGGIEPPNRGIKNCLPVLI
jgi:hypothetical protein